MFKKYWVVFIRLLEVICNAIDYGFAYLKYKIRGLFM